MRIIFMGTPDFAATALKSIMDSGKHEVVCVFTQPDKPKGRGKAMQYPDVKVAALEYGLTVHQPLNLNVPEVVSLIQEYAPECIVVAAYSQLLKPEILNIPRFGCVNIHASLLPKLRGAAPIQWAIINGDQYAGVTTMLMGKGLDTGDMLLKKAYELAPGETGGSLFDRLSILGGELILETLEGLENGTITPIPQTGESSYAKILTKETGNIDWTKTAGEIESLIRGLNPWPSAFSYLNGKMLKFWSARVLGQCSEVPGTVHILNKHSFAVACGDRYLEILELTPQGKKRMNADAWLRGTKLEEGMVFSSQK